MTRLSFPEAVDEIHTHLSGVGTLGLIPESSKNVLNGDERGRLVYSMLALAVHSIATIAIVTGRSLEEVADAVLGGLPAQDVWEQEHLPMLRQNAEQYDASLNDPRRGE